MVLGAGEQDRDHHPSTFILQDEETKGPAWLSGVCPLTLHMLQT